MFTEGRSPGWGASFTRFSGVRLQLFGITQHTLEAALHGTEVRQEAIARNLANANTPGYKRTDVSFQQELAEQLQFDPASIDSSFEPTLSVDCASRRTSRNSRRSRSAA